MKDFCILTDSSCDLPAKAAGELEISVVPLSVLIDGKSYSNYLDGREIGFEEYYALLRSGKSAVTSSVNVSQFLTIMEEMLLRGKNILYLGFSSALSGTYDAASLAAKELALKYPERKIRTIDTLSASLGQGLLVYLAARQAEAGKTMDEVADFVVKTRSHLCQWFTVDDLDFLHRGGRVSKATAVVGGALGIRPILHVDNGGRLTKAGVARGRKASIQALVEKMKASVSDPQDQTVFISHGDCIGDAESLARMIRDEVGVKTIFINYIGPVNGAHSGPGTLCLFFVGAER
ncbi:DegV family protein [Caproicibacter sp. BJN0012]|uniref:DegV family protein n=1 Tax=Caproicibacter sp. BJN0012 TaxID=3110227 RepID=UPI002E10D89B